MRTRVDMRIDSELLKRVDEARGDETRTAFTERAMELALKPVPTPQEAFDDAQEAFDDAELQRKIKVKQAHGLTRRVAEREAREELAR